MTGLVEVSDLWAAAEERATAGYIQLPMLGDWPAPSHPPHLCAFWAQRMHDPTVVPCAPLEAHLFSESGGWVAGVRAPLL